MCPYTPPPQTPPSLVQPINRDQSRSSLPNGEPGTPLKSAADVSSASSKQKGENSGNGQGAVRPHEQTGATPNNKKPMPTGNLTQIPLSFDDEFAAPPPVVNEANLGTEPDAPTTQQDKQVTEGEPPAAAAAATSTQQGKAFTEENIELPAAAAAGTSDDSKVATPPIVDAMARLGAEQDAPLTLVKKIVDPRTIPAGTPRSGTVVESFETHLYYDKMGKSDIGLQLFWQAKHTKFVKHGYTYLIGEVATYIDRHFKEYTSIYDRVYTGTTLASVKTFKKLGDIQTSDGSYEKIINSMYENNECTLATAIALLESLSLPQMNGKIEPETEPRELEISHGQALFAKLADKSNARKLMGALICEAIRFQEDGALARMAIRGVISLFPKDINLNLQIEPIESNPFYQVFVDGENPVVFAKKGGKLKTLQLFFNSFVDEDFLQLKAYINETSDVGETSDVDKTPGVDKTPSENKDSSQTEEKVVPPETPNERIKKPPARFTFTGLDARLKDKPISKQKNQEDIESLGIKPRNLAGDFSDEETEKEGMDSTLPDQDE